MTTVCGLTVATLALTAPATAEPYWQNPHYPNYANGYCEGGRGLFWCDGTHYPDESFWRMTPSQQVPICMVTVAGQPDPVPAQPGQCGGENK